MIVIVIICCCKPKTSRRAMYLYICLYAFICYVVHFNAYVNKILAVFLSKSFYFYFYYSDFESIFFIHIEDCLELAFLNS